MDILRWGWKPILLSNICSNSLEEVMKRFSAVVFSLVATAMLGCGGPIDVEGEEPNTSPDEVNMSLSQPLYAPAGGCTTKPGGCAKSSSMGMEYGKCTSFSMGGLSGCSCDNGGGSASDCSTSSSVSP
jgi:hypothetical protein